MRWTAVLGITLLHAPLALAASQTWDGWIIGEPCAAGYQVALQSMLGAAHTQLADLYAELHTLTKRL